MEHWKHSSLLFSLIFVAILAVSPDLFYAMLNL
jgi:Ca2+/Na+ antiporter